MTVEIADVRTALNEIDAEAIPDSVITQKIDQSKLIIDDDVEDEVIGTDKYEFAVTQMAAYMAFNSSPAQTQKSAIDLSAEWDVASFLEYLENQRDQALEMVGATQGGTSAGFFKHTDGILDDSSGW